MRKSDIVYYVGLFSGMIIGSLMASAFGVEGIFRFGAALVVGVGCGWFSEKLFHGRA